MHPKTEIGKQSASSLLYGHGSTIGTPTLLNGQELLPCKHGILKVCWNCSLPSTVLQRFTCRKGRTERSVPLELQCSLALGGNTASLLRGQSGRVVCHCLAVLGILEALGVEGELWNGSVVWPIGFVWTVYKSEDGRGSSEMFCSSYRFEKSQTGFV